ncbi:hypothetical protein MtrunA17_Chr1g0192891 [Medicago truncatula]|uniref:Transmembrane protein, putative n=1 Tax=Medicago truncatula TaxID=3880 RepID=A0A072VMN8_MEDTR|nr:transmembrane protein, putative [Medicago truncatula]RHN80869.1 hypothetical protein MtrunA17_Chr1g0192891 [Medicago truncatula]
MASVFRRVMLKLSATRWSELINISIVDEFVWGIVTAFESVALVSMLCFFFLSYGCTI